MSCDVAVIGAGLAGLAAAVSCASRGARVRVFEAQHLPGGYATSFQRGAFRFDASLHLLDGIEPGCANRPVWDALGLGETVETRVPRLVRREVWPDGSFDVPHGLPAYGDALCGFLPGADEGVARFVALSREMQQAFCADRDRRLVGATSPTMAPVFRESLDRTAGEVLRELFGSERAVAVTGTLACYLGLGPDDLAAIPFFSLIGSYHGQSSSYPVGGSQAITDALVRRLETAGGSIHCDARVEGLRCERGRVTGLRLADGETIAAGAVVSNASPLHTYGAFLAPRERPERLLRRLRAMPLGTSMIKVWIGARGGSAEEVAYESFLRRDYSTRFDGEGLADLGVVAPHVLDPGCCPPGHAVYTLSKGVEADREHPTRAQARETVEEMLDWAESTVLPGLRARIVVMSVATPSTFYEFTGNPGGSIHGFRAIPSQSGPRRLGIEGPIRSLFQVGAWTYAGSGFLPAMTSGMLAAEAIERNP